MSLLDMYLFNVLPTILSGDDTLHFAKLYEQHLNIFFSQRFNLIKNLSKCLGKEIVGSLAEISFLMYTEFFLFLRFCQTLLERPHGEAHGEATSRGISLNNKID